MSDEQTLRQVFRNDSVGVEAGDTITLHLVCRVSATPPNQPSSSSADSAGSSSRQAAARPTAAAAAGSNNEAGRRSQAQAQAGASAASGSAPLLPNNNPAFPVMTGTGMQFMWTPEQMALAQQMYQQLMAQMQSNPSALAAILPNVPVLPTLPVLSPAPGPVPVPLQQSPAPAPSPAIVQNHENHNNAMPNNNPPPPVVPAPAMARADDDDDDDDPDMREERDFLGRFYWLSRAVVLFSVIYFYSSLARLFLVLLFAVLMYMYQIGVFAQRNADDVLDERDLEPNVGEGNEDQENEGRAAAAAADLPPPQSAAGARRRGPNESEAATERSGLRMLWIIVSSLFTSLIPEPPPAHFN